MLLTLPLGTNMIHSFKPGGNGAPGGHLVLEENKEFGTAWVWRWQTESIVVRNFAGEFSRLNLWWFFSVALPVRLSIQTAPFHPLPESLDAESEPENCESESHLTQLLRTKFWVQEPLIICYVTLDRSLNFSKPQFSHLWNWDNHGFLCNKHLTKILSKRGFSRSF